MYYLLIEKFNNYNNRFLKRFDTIQEYVDDIWKLEKVTVTL